jgi:hypothetical protein
MEFLPARTRPTQPERRLLQMAQNHLSRRVVAISLGDQMLYLLRYQSAYGGSLFRSYDLCAANRGLFELNG